MKVTLLKETDFGLARPRPAGSEMDLDPSTAAQLIKDGHAELSIKELIAQAAADKKTIISKPAKDKGGPAAADSEAQ